MSFLSLSSVSATCLLKGTVFFNITILLSWSLTEPLSPSQEPLAVTPTSCRVGLTEGGVAAGEAHSADPAGE
ncbi:MAG: hypothetical protein BYD32DRAFT_417116 [Podila humilis]|nr:MAG: hypothetical protein BYD32DRAFT_417116 [Podila humilis]